MISGGLDDQPKFSAEEYVRGQTSLAALGDFSQPPSIFRTGLNLRRGKAGIINTLSTDIVDRVFIKEPRLFS